MLGLGALAVLVSVQAGWCLPPCGPGPVARAAAEALESMEVSFFDGEANGRVARAGSGRDIWFARDKAKHAGFSFLGTLGLAAWLRYEGMAESDCPGWAGGTVFSLGLFKEVAMDRHDPRSRASWQDAVANLAGVLGAGLIWGLAERP